MTLCTIRFVSCVSIVKIKAWFKAQRKHDAHCWTRIGIGFVLHSSQRHRRNHCGKLEVPLKIKKKEEERDTNDQTPFTAWKSTDDVLKSVSSPTCASSSHQDTRGSRLTFFVPEQSVTSAAYLLIPSVYSAVVTDLRPELLHTAGTLTVTVDSSHVANVTVILLVNTRRRKVICFLSL